MNAILSVMLSVNLFMSSLISPTLAVTLSPNPFINPSIRYDFIDYESAASYYYSQVVNNSIQYSDSDILTLLCVLANLYVDHKDSLSQDMQDNITYYYEHQLPDLQFWINHDLPFFNMLGYIVKPYSTFFDKGYKWLYSRFKSLGNYMDEYPHVYYFAYLYDNLSFTKTGVDPSPVLESDIKAAAESVQDVPYSIYPVIYAPEFTFSPSYFPNTDLYNSFLSDVSSFGAEHTYFGILVFNTRFQECFNLVPSSVGSNCYGYFLYSIPEGCAAVLSSTVDDNLKVLDFYYPNWNGVDWSQSEYICKYYQNSSVFDTNDFTIWIRGYSARTIKSSTANFTRDLLRNYSSTISSSYPYTYVDYYRPVIYTSYFSTKNHDIPVFNSLTDFENYTLANSLYYRSNDVVQQTISYDTINNIESLYIANETTYNSINNYVIDNSITNIDNSTQSVINKNYNFNFNFELDFDFNFTINNIKDNEQTEDNYLNDFLHKFESSGYKDFNFTSFTDSSGSSFSWGSNFVEVRSLMEAYYLHLPNKLKMALAGVFVTGLFGLVLSVVSKVRK